MRENKQMARALLVCVAVAATAFGMAVQDKTNLDLPKGTAVSFPWVFENGTETARTTALESGNDILHKAGYASIPFEVAQASWTSHKLRVPSFGHLPSRTRLQTFGRSLKADKVIYGSVSWHTRSIWVNMGPKTISTATINVYVYDVKSGKVDFTRKSIEGRSDEVSNNYKLAADVFFTPLVTAVSGGPATPQEQRAVQIAMGLALHDWVLPPDVTRSSLR
jgi:hypothetical protein